MKKTRKMPRILTLLLAAIMMLSATSMSVLATGVDSVIDKTHTDNSITLYKLDADSDDPIAGVGYTLYRVAEINQTTAGGSSVTTFDELYAAGTSYTIQGGTYQGITITLPSIDEINSLNAAKFDKAVIDALIELGIIEVAEAFTDSYGKVVFTGLDSGYVYLAVETTLPSGVSAANNFLITVPMYYQAGTTFDVDVKLADGTTLTAGDSLSTDQWIYDVVAYPKNNIDASTTKKTYVDGDAVDSVEYGQVFTYEVTTNIPSTLYPYLESNGTTVHYYDSYIIKDKAGANIEYVLNSANTIDATVKLYDATGTPVRDLVAGTDYMLTYNAATNSFGIELINQSYDFTNVAAGDITSYYNDARGGYQDGDYLVISYNAKIVANTAGTTDDTTNTVDIDTDGSDGEYTIPGTDKNTETYDYRVWKVGEDNDDTHDCDYVGLKGAEFALKDADGNYMALYTYTENGVTKYEWVKYAAEADWLNADVTDANAYDVSNPGTLTTKFTSDEYGLFTLVGLAAGDYTLIEVTAPDGYTLSAGEIKISVNKESDDKANTALNLATVEGTNQALDSSKDDSYYISIYIINKSTGAGGNWTLPTTGDMGIGIFILIGGVLIVAAVGLYVYNKKRNNSAKKA